MQLILIFVAIIAGLVQGVTGFGLGIVMMTILPFMLPLASSAAVANCVSLPLCFMMLLRYRKEVQYQHLIWPAIFYIFGSSLAILLAPLVDQRLLKILFSIFLITLALYFVKFDSRIHLKANFPTMFLSGLISGICDGLFGIGGPLMVLFYLSLLHSKEAYLGTLQGLFLLVGSYNFVFRLYRGIFTIDLLELAFLSSMAVLLGLAIGNRIIERIDSWLMNRLVYILIGLSGLLTLVTTLFY